jgi:hypothetical protein
LNRDKLTCICPVCGYEFWACKSIAQEMGARECGHGSCPGCNTFHNLTVDEVNKSMIVTPWDKYMKQKEGLIGEQIKN